MKRREPEILFPPRTVVVVEKLWWKPLDLLSNKAVSFFNIKNHETADLRWARARIRAAKGLLTEGFLWISSNYKFHSTGWQCSLFAFSFCNYLRTSSLPSILHDVCRYHRLGFRCLPNTVVFPVFQQRFQIMVGLSGREDISVPIGNGTWTFPADANGQVNGSALQEVYALQPKHYNLGHMAVPAGFHVRVVVFDWEDDYER